VHEENDYDEKNENRETFELYIDNDEKCFVKYGSMKAIRKL
jgi:hypothetical protein